MQLRFPFRVAGVIDPDAAETAKADGIGRAVENTGPDWATACRNAIELMARRGIPFQAADLIAEGLIDEPDSPARWGGAFSTAAKDGVIEHAPESTTKSKRVTVHRSLCRQWIGTARARTAGTEAAA
ncbi:hypothetical protein [Streptomyces sp. NPDC088674]|uniref:hypothetical protein n=1 Tax=Streptomyces sp. NPDC088674 TaxID=3365869 RepID=UPI0038225DCC